MKSKGESQVIRQWVAGRSPMHQVRHKYLMVECSNWQQCNTLLKMFDCHHRCSHAWRVTLKATFKGHQPTVATMRNAALWNKNFNNTRDSKQQNVAFRHFEHKLCRQSICRSSKNLKLLQRSHHSCKFTTPRLVTAPVLQSKSIWKSDCIDQVVRVV